MKLLTRNEFRRQVFERDDYKCIICGEEAQDAHHIIERRLFDDGGYYLDNGVSLCSKHHIEAEKTLLSCQDIRNYINITNIILPKGFYRDNKYDKWGNIILPNNQRIKGKLFYDESVQKILKDIILQGVFSDYIKYPRTKHLPWSEGVSRDDSVLETDKIFYGKEVVITEKMDGENASIYSDGYFHARSLSGNEHPSQSWVKSNIQKWCYELPREWRICGENLYATHSIKYENLKSYFYVFSIWNDKNLCLSWKDTEEWCELLGLQLVPVLYIGKYDSEYTKSLYNKMNKEKEGYVVRTIDSYHYTEFDNHIAKFVRANHITDENHNWRMRWNSDKINILEK